MDNLTSIIIAFITGILGPVVILTVKNYLDKNKKKPDMVRETLKVSELVNQNMNWCLNWLIKICISIKV